MTSRLIGSIMIQGTALSWLTIPEIAPRNVARDRVPAAPDGSRRSVKVSWTANRTVVSWASRTLAGIPDDSVTAGWAFSRHAPTIVPYSSPPWARRSDGSTRMRSSTWAPLVVVRSAGSKATETSWPLVEVIVSDARRRLKVPASHSSNRATGSWAPATLVLRSHVWKVRGPPDPGAVVGVGNDTRTSTAWVGSVAVSQAPSGAPGSSWMSGRVPVRLVE